MDPAVLHYYKQYRGNLERPMLDAYLSARQFVSFRKRLAEYVKPKRRRKAKRKAS